MGITLAVDNKAFDAGGAENSPQFRAGDGERPDPRSGFGGRLDTLTIMPGGHTLYAIARGAALPTWGTKARDAKLRELILDSENLLSGIVYGEVARVQNTTWKIAADNPDENAEDEEVKRWHKILNTANFRHGFREFVNDFARDYLSQDNGAFIELLVDNGRNRTHLPLKDSSEIIGIATMDSLQCFRTYDPEYPVVYYNPWTFEWSIYHYTKIIPVAQFKQGWEKAMGMGLCAVSRAYSAALLIKEAHVYVYEKISGAEPDFVFVSGIGHKQLDNAVEAAKTEAQMRGATRYKGTVFIAPPSIGPNHPAIDVKMVSMKSVPDGWSHAEEVETAIKKIALEFGLDPREIWIVNQSGATKADADIQDRKSSAKGRADIMKTLEDIFNHIILPEGITFKFDDDSIKAQLETERLKKARSDRMKLNIDAGVISPQEARQILASTGDLPTTFATGTMDESVTEMGTENVLAPTITDQQDTVQNANLPTPSPVQAEAGDNQDPKGRKDLGDALRAFGRFLDDLIDSAPTLDFFRVIAEMDAAVRLYGEMAFVAGLQKAGVNASFGNIPTQYQVFLDQSIREQQSFVAGFARDAINPNKRQQIAERVKLWLNKGLGSIYNTGLLVGQPDQLLQFKLGPTEHCRTCLGASDQVHTAREWLERGIYPRSSNLECGGFHCQCYFIDSEGNVVVGDLTDVPTAGLGGMLLPTPKRTSPFERLLSRLIGLLR